MNIICWKLNEKLDYEDDINDIHICVDYDSTDDLRSLLLGKEIINGQLLDTKREGIITLKCNDFPNENPKHTDVGFEEHSKDYKSSITVYKSIIIEIDTQKTEIELSENRNQSAVIINLNNTNLELLTSGIMKSKKMAYFYDNFLPIDFIIGDIKKESRLIFWAGKENDILYH